MPELSGADEIPVDTLDVVCHLKISLAFE